MSKIAIAVAPVGPWGRGQNNQLTPDEIGREVKRCADTGASIVHLHGRDLAGDLTPDMTVFTKTVRAVRESCDIILEASTGGLSSLSAKERLLTTENGYAEAGSLNLGSLNFGDEVYMNPTPAVFGWIEAMAGRGIKPSLEVFDTGNLVYALDLLHNGHLDPPCNFSFIFNVKWGMPYSPGLLQVLKGMLPDDAIFGCIFVANAGFALHLECASAGASVLRVGFEDSPLLENRRAENNAELVEVLRKALENAGHDIATVSEARDILGTTRRQTN